MDVTDELAACVAYPSAESCRTLNGLLFLLRQQPPSRPALNLLGRGLIENLGTCGPGTASNTFCKFSVDAAQAMRGQASVNPDAAIILWLQFLDALTRNDAAATLEEAEGVLATQGVPERGSTVQVVLDGLIENMPKSVVPQNRAKALLLLQTLSDLTQTPDLATRARRALDQLKQQPLPVPRLPPLLPLPPLPPARSPGAVVGWILGGSLALAGAVTYGLTRYARR